LETYSKSRTAESLSSLNFIRTKEAVLVEPQSEDNEAKTGFRVLSEASPIEGAENNTEYRDNRAARTRRISVEELDVGDTVSIAQGSSPPADSVVIAGTSSFDESSLSGESQLVSKELGDIVYAGTVNHGQVINARVLKASGDCMIDDVVKLVREGQNRHAPIERLADKLTAYFVPIICLIAVATWLIWLSLGLSGQLPDDYLDVDQGGWYFWSLGFAIAVFVVACPCGIALAAPMALYVGTALAAREFILARGGGEAFEEGSRLDYIVFDKTGTLTKGVEPVITDEALVLTGDSASRIIFSILELLEEGSSHPLARSIVSYCRAKQSASGRCVDMKEMPGKGTKGTLDVQGVAFEAIVGNERFMEEHGVVGLPEHLELLESWKKDGKSVILLAMRAEDSPVVGREFILAALFATADPLREEAPLVISALKRSGIDVWMITGDNAMTAAAVASQVGIPRSRVIAGVLPTEKVSLANKLSKVCTNDGLGRKSL
jgi:Cu+-exporting ATPase